MSHFKPTFSPWIYPLVASLDIINRLNYGRHIAKMWSVSMIFSTNSGSSCILVLTQQIFSSLHIYLTMSNNKPLLQVFQVYLYKYLALCLISESWSQAQTFLILKISKEHNFLLPFRNFINIYQKPY